MTAKKFQNYLTSNSTIDAHMLTNLEWGAGAYLTHSVYGLCTATDGVSTCQGVYHNNSSGYFTGRSMGMVAISVTNSTYGTYDYKGYKLDSTGKSMGDNDISKVASTPGNVTGVYDMSGGSYEYVMGNMVNSSKKFYSSSAGNIWNNTDWYDNFNSSLYSKYYNFYSYGTSYSDIAAFNRGRLGDATSEVLSGTSLMSAWKVGVGISGMSSCFLYNSAPWFARGGTNSDSNSGIFNFNVANGGSFNHISFRSSLS